MARPQAADYEQRREAIVAQAAELFAERSFHGASIADLAIACNISKSLFYHYYPSKEDVLFEVMVSHLDLLLQDVEASQQVDLAPKDRLRHALHLFLRHYVGAAASQKVLLNELGNLPQDKRDIIVRKQREVVSAVQAMVNAVKPGLADDPVHSRAITMLLFGMINWTHIWFRPDGAISVDELADLATDIFLGT